MNGYIKTVSAALLTALCLSLFSCGASPAEVTEAPAEETQTVTEAATEKQTEEPTEAPAETPAETPTEAPTEAVTEISEFERLITSGAELEYNAKRKFFMNAETKNGTNYRQAQGGCTDGEYMYFVMNDTKSENSMTLIYKFRINAKKPEQVSEPLQLDHANDMTYNPKTGQLIVVHNAPNKKKISFVDPQTLTVTGTGEVPNKIFSMQYNESRDQYVVGLAGGQNFALLDSEFQTVAKYEVESTGYTTQGVDADDDYIYFIQYNENVVVIYDWEGQRIAVIPVKLTGCEPESIFHADGKFYIGVAAGGLACYEIVLQEKKD